MADGAGFGVGFAKGFSRSLLQSRERADLRAREDRSRQDQLFAALLPKVLEEGLASGDTAGVEDFLQRYPEYLGGVGGGKAGARGKKSAGADPLGSVRNVLQRVFGIQRQMGGGRVNAPGNDLPSQGGMTGTQSIPVGRGRTPAAAPVTAPVTTSSAADGATLPVRDASTQGVPDFDRQPPGTPIPGQMPIPDVAAAVTGAAPAAAAASPATSLFGVQMLSPEQKIVRQTDLARRIFPVMQSIDPSFTMRDALAVTGFSLPSRGSSPYQAVHGVDGKGNEVSAVFDAGAGQFIDVTTRQPIPGFRQTGLSSPSFGVDREAISRAMFGVPFGKATQEQQAAVITEEQAMLQRESKARGTGSAAAKFEAPMDAKTAQEVGTTVGTSSAELAGQRVPTVAERDRRRSLETTRRDLDQIRNYLAILPKENEFAGVAPGATMALRRRSNAASGITGPDGKPISQRAAVAQLESVVDSVVNVLARTRGEQRGTQTEKDAERAYNALVNFKAGLLDPFGGDTQESAALRLQEALDGLDRVLAGLPQTPVADPSKKAKGEKGAADAKTAAPAPGAAPSLSGFTMRDGKLHLNGKPIE